MAKTKLSKKAKEVIEAVESMSVLELNELVKALEERFGVTPLPTAAVPAEAAPKEEAKTEEKARYNIELTEAGKNKIAVIKAVREINPSLGLKEAKDLVEGVPKIIAEEVKKEEAEAAKKKLEEVGAKVELK